MEQSQKILKTPAKADYIQIEKYVVARRYYDLVWQDKPSDRTNLIKETYFFPKSVEDRIEAGHGFPDFQLNETAQKELQSLIKFIREMPLEKRTRLADFMCEEREHGFGYIHNTVIEYLHGDWELFQPIDDDEKTLRARTNMAHYCPKYKMNRDKLSHQLNKGTQIICMLLDEDMKKVSQDICQPDTRREKLKHIGRLTRASIDYGFEKITRKIKRLFRRKPSLEGLIEHLREWEESHQVHQIDLEALKQFNQEHNQTTQNETLYSPIENKEMPSVSRIATHRFSQQQNNAIIEARGTREKGN